MRPEEFFITAALIEPPETIRETAWPRLDDESFWHESVPCAVLESYAADDAAGWKAWKRHLLCRRRPVALSRLAGGKANMLTWGQAPPPEASRLARLLRLLDNRRSKRGSGADSVVADAQRWLADRAASHDEPFSSNHLRQHDGRNGDAHHSNGKMPIYARQSDCSNSLESLACLHLLVTRIDLFDCDLWWRICRELVAIARATAIALDVDPLGHQLSAGELPLLLAYLFPEINPCRGLRAGAAAALSCGMAELLDGEGLPQCRHLPEFPALVACWTRCRLLGEHLDGGCWAAEAEVEFPLALREVVRLSRPDGSPALIASSGAAGSANTAWLVDIAAELITDKPTRRLIRGVLGGRREKSALRIKQRQLPAPAVHSEWAEIAVLRTDWSRRAERLTVAYGDRAVRLELAVGADQFLSGRWEGEVRADGAVAEPTGEWREVCWVSDDDCDYLELEMELAGALRVQRQMLLSRKDRFLFLADAVLGDRPQELSYRARLPLAGRLTTSAAAESREVLLEGQKARALVLPLALPEWRADRRGGSLGIDCGALDLRQTCHGRSLFAPLWIDLSRRRADKAFTWRQLTVAEQRQNQPRDVAVGYRVQFGRRQWLIYRSLATPGNRTVLGQNLSTDFFLGRFNRDGESEAILEIE